MAQGWTKAEIIGVIRDRATELQGSDDPAKMTAAGVLSAIAMRLESGEAELHELIIDYRPHNHPCGVTVGIDSISETVVWCSHD